MDKKNEILYGFHPVFEGLRVNRRVFIEIRYTTARETHRLEKLLRLANDRHVPAITANSEQLRKISGVSSHQGVCALVSPLVLPNLNALLHTAGSRGSHPFLLLLDSIIDPQNLGAILRTALCAGVDGVVIPKDRAAPLTPAVSKASAGALEHLPVCRITNMAATIKTMKERGYWIAGLDAGAGQTLYNSDLTGALAIVIGGEEKGIRPLIRKQCDFLMSIPQKGPLNSLNASAAAAVALYEAYRQRQAS